MKNILITGINGLIGQSLTGQLKADSSINIYGLGRSDAAWKNTIIIDLEREWSTGQLPEKMDIIIHLAQSEKFRDFPNYSLDVFNVNTYSTLKLLEYARISGVQKFIYASSGGIYGNKEYGFNEEDPVVARKDLGFYLSTKFCSEIIAENYAPYFNLDILRFFFVYGKNQRRSMLIPRLVDNVKNGIPISIDGQEGIKINPIYVDDAVSAIIKSLQLTGYHKINIGGAEILSLREIVNIIGKETNIAPKYIIKDSVPKNLIGDISKMNKLLTYPKVTLAEGIRSLL